MGKAANPDKQKAAFLRKEGWVRGKTENAGKVEECWWHARTSALGNLSGAFRLATHRKSARDTQRLKAAGWRATRMVGGPRHAWQSINHARGWYTKAEALEIVRAAPTQSKEERHG